MGDKGTNAQGGPDAAGAVQEALPEGGGASPLDRGKGVPRAREDVEPRGPRMDRRAAENGAYWLRNWEDYDTKALEALEHVHGGGAPCARLRFEIAFLISQECVDWD